MLAAYDLSYPTGSDRAWDFSAHEGADPYAHMADVNGDGEADAVAVGAREDAAVLIACLSEQAEPECGVATFEAGAFDGLRVKLWDAGAPPLGPSVYVWVESCDLSEPTDSGLSAATCSGGGYAVEDGQLVYAGSFN